VTETEKKLYKENTKLKKELKSRRKLKGLDKYLVFSFAMLIIFTVAQTVITAVTGVEQSTLITSYFAAFGGEVLMCALIKRLKLKNESGGTDNE
jgi:archaellum biogenesis protein FlaJ (TadC family)